MHSIIRQLLRSDRLSVLFLLFGSTFLGLLNTFFIDFISKSVTQDYDTKIDSLVILAGITLTIISLQFGCGYVGAKWSLTTSNNIRYQLMHLIRTSSAEFQESQGHDSLLSTLNADVNAISSCLIIIPALLSSLFILAGMLTYIYMVGGALILVCTVVFLSVSTLIYLRISHKSIYFLRKKRIMMQVMTSHISDLVFGYKETISNNTLGIKLIDGASKNTANEIMDYGLSASKYQLFASGSFLLFLNGLLILVLYSSTSVANMQTSSVIALVLAILNIGRPIKELIGVYPMILRCVVSLERVANIEKKTNANLCSGSFKEDGWAQTTSNSLEIFIDQVVFKYEGSSIDALSSVSLKLYPSKITFLIGSNGCGKTTFLKILTGLYTPTSGSIYLSGNQVSSETLVNYRSQFSVLFSDFWIHKSEIDMVLIESKIPPEMLDKFNFYSIRKKCANGLSTKDLSTGEQRTLAILITVSKAKPVIVLDEPCLGLDPETREWLYSIFFPFLRSVGKCLVVVSHDDKYFNKADYLYSVNDGLIERYTVG